ncbi:hypothetical protein D9756_010762 [Leucocoprinus leucothites]|uniref:Uncharacterized protein n=1 Tax=Leucocoprinus leucothites TaxID=201217 RepID=A0A8H5FTI9_9AGAR|nr:hypothetical protein D9756_010762 [Leucoagaricus leucothites]
MTLPTSIFSCPIPLPRTPLEDIITVHPIPLILEDMQGSLQRTRLQDCDGRGYFSISPWQQDQYRGIRIKGDIQCSPFGNRVVFVEWGDETGQGTVSVENPAKLELEVDLAQYLPVVNPEKHTPQTIATASRRFTSFLDGNEYTWIYHPPENLEMQWECVDLAGETIAYYSLKIPNEPEYMSSGCSLTVINQKHDFLALEMVTTCWIVRTFQKRFNEAAQAAREANGEVDQESESDSDSVIARARVAWENRWADCESSDESPPSSEEGDGGDALSERSTTSSRDEISRGQEQEEVS